MSDVSPIPEGMHTLQPYLVVPNAIEAMAFYEQALGAKQCVHMPGPGGQGTMYAEMSIGDSTFMITDENPEWDQKSPGTIGGSPVSFMLYVENSDAAFEQATAAGCQVIFPVSDMFWGDRMGKFVDPYGYQWMVATHVEEVPPEEMGKRQEAWFAEMQSAGG